MSYDSDFESVYMVQFESGRVIYTSFYEVEDVKQYCYGEYPKDTIKAIYKEVYLGEGEDEE